MRNPWEVKTWRGQVSREVAIGIRLHSSNWATLLRAQVQVTSKAVARSCSLLHPNGQCKSAGLGLLNGLRNITKMHGSGLDW